MVSATNQLKLLSPDGKRRLTDVLDSDSVILLAKNYPNNRTNSFLDWFVPGTNPVVSFAIWGVQNNLFE